jgi:hypothetical protein
MQLMRISPITAAARASATLRPFFRSDSVIKWQIPMEKALGVGRNRGLHNYRPPSLGPALAIKPFWTDWPCRQVVLDLNAESWLHSILENALVNCLTKDRLVLQSAV